MVTPSLAGNSVLLGVSAVSARDVWAVGVRSSGGVDAGPLLSEHWNGERWSLVPTPGFRNGFLNAVSAAPTGDVWAVGAHGKRPLAMRWNGHAWEIVATPDAGPSAFYGVAVVARNDVWAVGTRAAFHYEISGAGGALIEHWDGRRWQIVADADASPNEQFALEGIAANGPNDIWAVGGYWHRNGRCAGL